MASKISFRDFRLMGVMGGVFATLGLGISAVSGQIFYLYNFSIIGLSLVLGMGLWPFLPHKHKPWARRLSQILVGGYMFFGLGMGLIYLFFGVIAPENMQIEGFWFWLLGGLSAASVMHYLIAKILGPFLFNRGWCGWACWTVALLDCLPWKKPPGRLAKGWERLRYLHFALGLALVLFLVFLGDYGLEQTLGVVGPLPEGGQAVPSYDSLWRVPELQWFLYGNLGYFGAGLLLALGLKDNRAFCKYLCPIAVFLKLGSRAALAKIDDTRGSCNGCGRCETHCPMDIRLTDYLQRGERIASSECILCLTCTSVCPQQTLHLNFGLDFGLEDRLRRKDTAARPGPSGANPFPVDDGGNDP